MIEPDDESVSYGPGYMGDATKWCYWSTDYPDEGSCGPFDSKHEAMEHAKTSGAYDS